MSACDATKCPKLDTTLKAEIPKGCKDADRPLNRMWTLVLDAVGLLSSLKELHNSCRRMIEATVEATAFLRNTNANISIGRGR